MSNFKDKTDDYPTLSRPFEWMKSEYDVVIVGSGYGAGVAASRMARTGKSVAVWVISVYFPTMYGRHEHLRKLYEERSHLEVAVKE
ncbi:uncharacterized protein N7529_003833 [Penicillium soppii]|uniref:uncharacterized protein n=1 Tax=Penicillium soppii TaxID=69789 RepID=UPI0025486179|nr:uncharacterized protein N7529_003833 [Penicillium soppii]KAJ5871480.1 hypothetical protein N7529_003833 [Penicillium soppii]